MVLVISSSSVSNLSRGYSLAFRYFDLAPHTNSHSQHHVTRWLFWGEIYSSSNLSQLLTLYYFELGSVQIHPSYELALSLNIRRRG